MPSARQHREWAVRNVRFYRDVRTLSGGWRDWLLTILFYVAVHDVKAFFAAKRSYFSGGRVPKNHREIEETLRTTPPWRRLGTYYESFFRLSRRSRYECWIPGEGDLANARRLLRLIRAEIHRLT